MRRLLCAEIILKSSSIDKLKFYSDFSKEACDAFGAKSSGIMNLPRKMRYYTVLKSVFKYKQAQETFEKRTYQRMIKVYNTHPETLNNLLYYINDNSVDGVELKTNEYSYEDNTLNERMDKELSQILADNNAWIPTKVERDPNVQIKSQLKMLREKVRKPVGKQK